MTPSHSFPSFAGFRIDTIDFLRSPSSEFGPFFCVVTSSNTFLVILLALRPAINQIGVPLPSLGGDALIGLPTAGGDCLCPCCCPCCI